MKKNLKISIATAITLASISAFTGCKFNDVTDSVSSSTTNISGVAVDGYISEATVTYGSKTTTTDSNGAWSLSGISNSDFGGTTTTLSVTGGTDTSTGEAFEGTLTSVLPETTSDTTVVITPISTLVQKYIANNSGTTISSAKSVMATTLKVDVADLDVDPVANIQDSDSQAILKAITKVQKIQEAMTDAGVSDAFSELSKKVTASTTNIDTVIENTIADTSVVSNTDVRNALQAIQTTVKSVLNTTINSTASLAIAAKTADAATKETETLLADNNLSGAAQKAKATALIIDQIKDKVEAGNSVTQAAAVLNEYNASALSTLASTYDTVKEDAGDSNFDAIIQLVSEGKSLSAAASESGADLNTSTLDTLTSTENTVSEVKSQNAQGKTLTISTIALATADSNSSNDLNISTSSTADINISLADYNLSDFYDVNFSDSNVSEAFEEQNISITIKLVNTADTGDTLTLIASGIILDDNGSTGLKTTLPVDSNVSITEVVNGTTSSYSLTLSSAIVNTDFAFNLQNVINNQSNNTSINNGLTKMNTRFNNSAGKSYKSTTSISGLDFNKLKTSKTSYTYTININN